MTDQHPITPPPELVQQWALMIEQHTDTEVFTIAAEWGADQELEACCEWIPKWTPWDADQLRAARRPQPPSLKRVALLQLDTLNADLGLEGKGVDLSQIRRALEQLDD